MNECMRGLYANSKILILNFDNLPAGIAMQEDIRHYFEECEAQGLDPRSPELRQSFNDTLLDYSKMRYLVSCYAEDRSSMLQGSTIAKEARTLHLGVDIFCRDLEPIFAPCAGQIIRIGHEPENHSFGYYAILRPDSENLPYMFFGHLSAKMEISSGRVAAGQHFATIGDFKNLENGGWSRHLHLQMMSELPEDGQAPFGYASSAQLPELIELYPDPIPYFPSWRIRGYKPV